MRYTTYHCGKAVIKDKNKLAEAMEKLARLEDADDTNVLSRWIPCNERMPKGTVLCCDDRGNMLVGLLCKDEAGYMAYGDDGQKCITVLHGCRCRNHTNKTTKELRND